MEEDKSKATRRLSPEDWLEHALDILGQDGIEGLHVDELAGSLGAGISSFYKYFKDQLQFLEQLLQYWAEKYTTSAIRRLEKLNVSASERLLGIMTLLEEERLGKHEVALRSWAAHDAMAASAIRPAHPLCG